MGVNLDLIKCGMVFVFGENFLCEQVEGYVDWFFFYIYVGNLKSFVLVVDVLV